MRAYRGVAFLGLAVFVAWSCGRAAKVEEAYEAADAAYEKASTPEEKVAVFEQFLARFPDTEHTTDAVQTVVYHLAHELNKPAEADAFVTKSLAGIKNAERRRDVTFERLSLLATLHRIDEVGALAAELSEGRALTYREAMEIADAATEAGSWDLALRNYEVAAPFATAETYRAENPNAALSEDRVERAVRRRKAATAAGAAWAESNLGHLDKALTLFAEARRNDLIRYLGNTDSELGIYEGRTLLAAGRVDEALAVLAPEALFRGEPEAVEAFRQAYVAKVGSDRDFEAYLDAERERLARPAADFTLPDYQGRRHSLSELRNGEVALLAFWFPT